MNASEIQIFQMEDKHESAYQEFVRIHPESMFYHSLEYLYFLRKILGAELYVIIAAHVDRKILGVLPAMRKEGAMGFVYNSLPFYGSNGGILTTSDAIATRLIQEWNSHTSKPEVLSATIIGNPLAKTDLSQRVTHNLTDFRIGQFTEIAYANHHAEQLMESFHSKTRNMVRKGQKQGFTFSIENDSVDFLREVHQENMSAVGGRAKSNDFFENVSAYFKANTNYRIWVARHNGEPVSAMLLFYYRDMVEYYTPVIRATWRDRQPLSMLIFEAMCDASKRGYRLWNWGGTWATQDGVYLFKKRWGARDCNYTYYIRINDERLYMTPRKTLLWEYPNFFVIPFNLLKGTN